MIQLKNSTKNIVDTMHMFLLAVTAWHACITAIITPGRYWIGNNILAIFDISITPAWTKNNGDSCGS